MPAFRKTFPAAGGKCWDIMPPQWVGGLTRMLGRPVNRLC
ncbi:hypothetical protein FRACA_2270002 [Frankia canadensis]|uniref:Uncharacterized protein n=1 Tax=Frankia canadensis TaxID=1836972 RepID=A0A2I2KR93_9ACTN|nr:hypothetical protein FRACA_2270002 [Frankia canadensis]SOU55474.1 hypothetical protein FRACA_2270002 [Frankia canadensis]